MVVMSGGEINKVVGKRRDDQDKATPTPCVLRTARASGSASSLVAHIMQSCFGASTAY